MKGLKLLRSKVKRVKEVTVVENNKEKIMDSFENKNRFTGINKIKDVFAKLGSEKIIKGSITAGLLLFALFLCLATCSLGYNVKVGNNNIGMVVSKEMVEETISDINEEVFQLTGKNFNLNDELDVSFGVGFKRDIVEHDELAEKLKSSSEMMIPAYTIVIDDRAVVALPSEDMALDVLDEYKNSFITDEMKAEAKFANDVSVNYMFAPKDILITKEAAVSYLADGDYTYYKAETDETVSAVSEKTGIAEEAILRENYIEGNSVKAGQVLKLYSGRMFADVVAVERVQREEAIPFETVKKDSDEVYKGDTKIEINGEEGVRYIDECLTYINGVVTKRDVYTDEIIKEPVAQVELSGTKEVPPSVGSGNLEMPTSGSLSSRFGSRWGRQHQGIDMSAAVGTPIYAADNGTVTYSQFNDGGYGYLVKIDHGNGIETFYAHCSELLVKQGQVVAKGDLIAKVGNTGRSTGPHLHFEVRQNGTAIDPMPYLNKQ